MGDDTAAIDTVLACDIERSDLLAEEASILAQLEASGAAAPAAPSDGQAAAANGMAAPAAAAANGAPPAAGEQQLELARRLEVVSKRLHEIDAYGAEARAAAILAGLSFDPAMQVGPSASRSSFLLGLQGPGPLRVHPWPLFRLQPCPPSSTPPALSLPQQPLFCCFWFAAGAPFLQFLSTHEPVFNLSSIAQFQ